MGYLYAELLASIDRTDPAFSSETRSIDAVTCRCRRIGEAFKLESWAYPLTIGQSLPNLPVWLSEELSVSLALDASYEETCRVLRIPSV